MKRSGLLKECGIINGEERTSATTFEVFNPASQAIIARVPDLNLADLDEAIAGSETAFAQLRRTTGFERAAMLQKWNELMLKHSEELATIITLENGKPIAEARGEVAYAASFLSWFAGEAPRVYGDVLAPSNALNRALAIKQPVGVVGMITPWNFPAAMITRKVAAALAAGCTSVVKPDASTPLTAIALAKLALEAGVPSGALNVVPVSRDGAAEVGKKLSIDRRVRKLSFTGSTAVGKLLMQQSASSLKKLSLELGGNAPFIVFDDVPDVAAAAAAAAVSKFRSSGQTCVCANRIFVQSSIYDEFVERLTDIAQGFTVGEGFAEGITHGPLIDERALAKVERHVADAAALGGEILVGGTRTAIDIGPNFYQPTVISGATSAMAIAGEETFGPVAGIFKFEDEDEVVREANSVDAGLASYVMSRDVSRVFRVAERLDFGMVGVNTGLISDCAVPFGGVKDSGFGREGSKFGIDGQYRD